MHIKERSFDCRDLVPNILNDTVGTCSNLIPYRRKWSSKKTKIESKIKKIRRHKCSIEVRCKMLCSEKLPLWKLVNQLVWSAGKLTPHFLSFPNHLILPVKVAQYSFWQNTLNKACPGSVEVIKDGYMLKCKKFTKNNVLYKTTTPHVYQNMNIVL